MRWLNISRRERRVFLGGIVLVFGMLTASRGYPWWRRWDQETRAGSRELRTEMVRAEASVRALPAILDSLERRKERFIALAPYLMGVENPAAGAGALASLVSGFAQRAGMTVGTMHVRTDSTRIPAIGRVSVQAEATGDVRSLMSLLSALERGPAMLRIRELSITQPAPAASAAEPEALRMRIVVDGLVLDHNALGVD